MIKNYLAIDIYILKSYVYHYILIQVVRLIDLGCASNNCTESKIMLKFGFLSSLMKAMICKSVYLYLYLILEGLA